MIRLVFSLFLVSAALLPAAPNSSLDPVWERLRALAGEWEGSYGTTKSSLTFSVVSGGHAVMESMKMPAPAPDMVTMYHRDGSALLATHYCSVGNQPRMRAVEASEDGKVIKFRFQDITNLPGPEATHIRHLTITFVDADHITEDWVGWDGKKEVNSVFQWSRKKK